MFKNNEIIQTMLLIPLIDQLTCISKVMQQAGALGL
jgi:hypothetical protein